MKFHKIDITRKKNKRNQHIKNKTVKNIYKPTSKLHGGKPRLSKPKPLDVANKSSPIVIQSKKDVTSVSPIETKKDVKPTSPTETKKDVTPASSVETKKDVTPASSVETKKDVTPASSVETKKDVKPASSVETKKDVKPASSVETKKDVKPTSSVETEKDVKPASSVETKKDVKPTSSLETKKDVKPTSSLETKKDVTPASSVETEKDVTPASSVETKKDVKPVSPVEAKKDVKSKNDESLSKVSQSDNNMKCIFKKIPSDLMDPQNVVNMLYIQQQNFVKVYFFPADNNICLGEARENLLPYLNAIYYRTKNESQLQLLIDIWNNNLDDANLKITLNDITSNSKNESNARTTNTTKNDVIKSLDQFDCDPTKIDTTVPDNKEEATNKINTIDSYLFTCANNENESQILDLWLEYLDNYKEKHGELPQGMNIINKCKALFSGNMNYDIVPENYSDALEKSLQYIDLLTKDEGTNNSVCKGSILAALNIYSANMDNKFPDSDDEAKQERPLVDTTTNADQQPLSYITSENINNMFNKLLSPDKDTISMVKFINFMTNQSNKDSIQVRRAIGFDEPLTRKNVLDAKDNSIENIANFSKNTQIFYSLWKTFTEFNNTMQYGGDDELESNVTEMGIDQFSKFINCGQYRNKDENIFDCKNVEPPTEQPSTEQPSTEQPSTEQPSTEQPSTEQPSTEQPSTEQPVQSPTNSAINISTGSIDSNNIELQINEKDFNGNFKRVDVSIFIPTDGKVIVRDYAKDTANQTIVGLSNYGP